MLLRNSAETFTLLHADEVVDPADIEKTDRSLETSEQMTELTEYFKINR